MTLVETPDGLVVAVQFAPGVDVLVPEKSRAKQVDMDLAKLTKADLDAERAKPEHDQGRPAWLKTVVAEPLEEPA